MRWQNIHRISPHRRCKPIALTVFLFAVTVLARPAAAQTISMFANADKDWTRIGVPPTHPVSDVGQWHIDAAKRTIICDGNGGHEWLRFNRELGDFEFRVKWRFTPVPNNTGYNNGVFFRNNEEVPSGIRPRPRSPAAISSVSLRSTASPRVSICKRR